MKLLFLAWNRIKSWRRDYRAISSVLLGIGLCLYNITRYFSFSNAVGTSVQVFEAYIIAGSTAQIFLGLFLGNLLLISDAPFITPLSKYEIIRIGRRKWLDSQIIYIFLSCIVYSMILLFFTVLFSFLFCGVSLANTWSKAIYMLADSQPSFAANIFRISFPYPDFIHSTTPLYAVFLTLFFNSLYTIILGLCILLFNLLTSKNWGWVFASILHILGYIIYANSGFFIPLRYSLLCCALPAYHFVSYLKMSFLYVLFLYTSIIAILLTCCKKVINKTEICRLW